MHAEKYSIFMFPLLIILRRNVEVMHNLGFQIVPWFSLAFFSNAGDLKFETSGVSSNGSCCLIDLMNAKRWEIQFFNEFCLSSSKLNLWVWVRWISTQNSRSHGSWHSLKFPWSELPISSVIWTWRYISFKTHDICILRSFQEVIPFLSMLRILPTSPGQLSAIAHYKLQNLPRHCDILVRDQRNPFWTELQVRDKK